MISVLIGVLIICVVGAICFWAIEKFVRDRRLENLLKLLVVFDLLGGDPSAGAAADGNLLASATAHDEVGDLDR